MKVKVRPATIDDAFDACDVIRSSIIECCKDDHRGDNAVLQAWLLNKTPECVQRLILTPGAFSVVASIDEVIVGFGSACETGKLTLCYVAPSFRFIGIGKALLEAIEETLAQAGVRTLRLQSTRTARTFYLRNGFVPAGSAALTFGIEGLPMRKELMPGG